jgi:hypothetical protein
VTRPLGQCKKYITYELLGLVIKRSNNIISLFKVLENIRIDAWFLSRKNRVKLKI